MAFWEAPFNAMFSVTWPHVCVMTRPDAEHIGPHIEQE